MTQILLVEREKALKENRRANNEKHRQVDVMNVEREKSLKLNLSKREAQLQALAAAERARRAANPKAQKQQQPKHNDVSIRQQHASGARGQKSLIPSKEREVASGNTSSQGPVTRPESRAESQPPRPPRGVCTVVKVHPDGFVDLQLSNGEIIERVEQSWLQRLGRPPSEAEAPPPSASRPGTGASRPPTGASRPPTAATGPTMGNTSPPSKPPDTAERSSNTHDLAAVVDLDETLAGMGRRGGRSNLGAQRAQLSEISSLLSWQ